MAESIPDESGGKEAVESTTTAGSWFRSVSQMASRVSKVDYNDVLEHCLKDLVEFRPADQQGSEGEQEKDKRDTEKPTRSENEAGNDGAARNENKVQESLDSVGKSLEDIGKTVYTSTRSIFGQIRQAVENDFKSDPKESGAQPLTESKEGEPSSSGTVADEEFQQRVEAMQRDSGTYCDEPEDEEDFQEWLKTFALDERKGEVEEILKSNSFMNELQSRIVPVIVDYDEFWTHYFYKVHKLKEEFEKKSQAKQEEAGETVLPPENATQEEANDTEHPPENATQEEANDTVHPPENATREESNDTVHPPENATQEEANDTEHPPENATQEEANDTVHPPENATREESNDTVLSPETTAQEVADETGNRPECATKKEAGEPNPN
eukprot:CAMPEP_0113926320 /NCGR_PEP_ID=MMETSP1159-20121227/3693_1 /TAXON_ID=88271 /ORGANISM="Picocystis salinarum" /LENGTH=382 /DNA_ID=CAMNT_0000926707 /DNA_START=11 /DNA_END=1159 /DNA_ORIENTATION=- /assembly_acc=CAM_ASM_000767